MDPLFSLISTTCTIKITGLCSSTEKLLLPSTLLVCKSSVIICTQALITLHYMAWLFGMWKLSIIAFPLLQMSLGGRNQRQFSQVEKPSSICLLFMHVAPTMMLISFFRMHVSCCDVSLSLLYDTISVPFFVPKVMNSELECVYLRTFCNFATAVNGLLWDLLMWFEDMSHALLRSWTWSWILPRRLHGMKAK